MGSYSFLMGGLVISWSLVATEAGGECTRTDEGLQDSSCSIAVFADV